MINVNTIDHCQNTFLHIAAKKDDCQFLKVLLAKKPNVNCQNSDGNTPLHLALSFEVAKLLVEYGTYVNIIDKWGRTLPRRLHKQIHCMSFIELTKET